MNKTFSHSIPSAFLLRFRLVLISLILGCTCLFVLLYSNNVVRRETARRFHSEGADLFSIIHRHGKSGRGASQIRRLQPFLLNVLKRDPSFIAGVTTESHRLESVRYQGNEIETAVIGVTAGYRTVFNLTLQQGRFISELDSTAAFCVVGNRLYKRWTQNTADSLVGRSLQVGRQICRVIGVLAPSPALSGTYRLDDAVLLPYYTMMQFSKEKEFTKVTLAAQPSRAIAETADHIQTRLTQLVGDISTYEISNQVLFAHRIAQSMRFISIFAGGLAGMALLFGAWQLYLILILDKNIAGPANLDKPAGRSMVVRSLLIGAMTSLGGVLIGQGVVWIIGNLNNWIWQLDPAPILLTVLIGCALTGFIGWRVQSTASAG